MVVVDTLKSKCDHPREACRMRRRPRTAFGGNSSPKLKIWYPKRNGKGLIKNIKRQ